MLIVAKIGGSILKQETSPDLISDIKNVLSGNRVVLVHGGGVEVTEVASKMGKPQEFVVSPEGFSSRYTDKETIEIYTMAMVGKINKQIVCALQSQDIPAVGLSGLDGRLVQAKRKEKLIVVDPRGRKKVVDGGYTGKISGVNTNLLQVLLQSGYVPVVAPVAIGEQSEPLNIDGDRTAAYIAGSLKADRLILLTDVEGLILNGKVVSKLNVLEAKDSLPKIGRGMITKINAATEALSMGVGEVLISSGLAKFPISSPLKHECGTVISRE
jgi:acetylglutamate/LysW-gamma-L-alpha-aminoadipate kinase